jgi:hypothetical protein
MRQLRISALLIMALSGSGCTEDPDAPRVPPIPAEATASPAPVLPTTATARVRPGGAPLERRPKRVPGS